MAAIVKLEGTIVNVVLFQPQEGQNQKPHQKIDILQVIQGGGSNLETIKDFDLARHHDIGQRVSLSCIATIYYFNSKPGVSYKVFDGDLKSLDISESHPLDQMPSGSPKKETSGSGISTKK